jgi:hypothetical protein
MRRPLVRAAALSLLTVSVFTVGVTAQGPAKRGDSIVRGSAAYAEVLLRETELRAEVESLLLEHTEDFPSVKASRYAIALIEKEKGKLLSLSEKDFGKLTLALGKIQVRKVEAQMELWRLQQSLADGHPDVKRAKRKVEVFEAAIREILG